ncbi:MAG: hypothetical protein ACP5L4_03890 [Thermoplasmata archaeon]
MIIILNDRKNHVGVRYSREEFIKTMIDSIKNDSIETRKNPYFISLLIKNDLRDIAVKNTERANCTPANNSDIIHIIIKRVNYKFYNS